MPQALTSRDISACTVMQRTPGATSATASTGASEKSFCSAASTSVTTKGASPGPPALSLPLDARGVEGGAAVAVTAAEAGCEGADDRRLKLRGNLGAEALRPSGLRHVGAVLTAAWRCCPTRRRGRE